MNIGIPFYYLESFFDFVILKRIITFFNALKVIKDKVRYKIFASKPIQEIKKTVWLKLLFVLFRYLNLLPRYKDLKYL